MKQLQYGLFLPDFRHMLFPLHMIAYALICDETLWMLLPVSDLFTWWSVNFTGGPSGRCRRGVATCSSSTWSPCMYWPWWQRVASRTASTLPIARWVLTTSAWQASCLLLSLCESADNKPSSLPFTIGGQLYVLGTLLSMQISFVGFQPVQSSEHMAVSLGVSIFCIL